MAFRTAFVLASVASVAADSNLLSQALGKEEQEMKQLEQASKQQSATPASQAGSKSGKATAHGASANNRQTEHKENAKERTEQRLTLREDRIQNGRKAVQQALTEMAAHRTSLSALAKNHDQIDLLASQIESRVTPTLTDEQRKGLENRYAIQLDAIRKTNMSDDGAQQAVAGSEAGAETALTTLRDADRKDARSLRTEFSKSRHEAHAKVRDMARTAKEFLHSMGSGSDLEMLLERAGKPEHTYDHAEDDLQRQKDRYMDHIDSLHDKMDDLVEDIYSKVHERLEEKTDALEEDASSRREQRRKAVREAAETLKMSGSLGRVEEKLHRLETALQKSQTSQEEQMASPVFIRSNTICTALITAGVVASLIMHAMQRRPETRRVSRSVNQPVLLA